MMIGLVIMYAIGPQRAHVLNMAHNTDFYTNTYFVIRQTISLLVALAALVALAVTPLAVLHKYAGKILLAGLVACALLMIFGNWLGVEAITRCTNGACRWFDVGPVSFQPAELLKFGVLIYLARFIGNAMTNKSLNDWRETIWPMLAIVGLATFFIAVVQKDMGTSLSMLSIVVAILLVSGMSWRILGKLAIGLAGVGLVLIISAPHRMERIMTFFNTHEGDSLQTQKDSGYHIEQAKLAIGSGGLFGLGIGNSVQATGYLPEAINDSVFAIMGETFGFVGLVIILGLFAALLMRLLKISSLLSDPWLQLLVAGVFGWLASHIVLNIASMVGIIPLTGITLPLLSFGGTSMAFIAAAIGVAFQASRYTNFAVNEREEHAHTGRRGRVGWSRDTSRRRIS
jgi:cell division protein FtsW